MICRVDDERQPDQLTELQRLDLPEAAAHSLAPDTALDTLETRATDTAHQVARSLLLQQWAAVDQQLVADYPLLFPLGVVRRDGHDPLKVATRVGLLELPRQVCYHPEAHTHCLPGHQALPAHGGRLVTRSLQQWSCLFSLDFPVPTVQRLLGWAAQEPTILSTTEQRCLFRRSRKLSGRAAEATEAAAGLARAATGAAVVGPPQLVPATEPRRPASWPAALGPTVAAALAAAVPVAPAGVSTAWERVLAVRAEERAYAALESVAEPVWEGEDLDTLSHLGPEIAPGEIVVAADEVWVRLPKKRALGELRTARVSTPTGYRYLSGTGEAFLRQLLYFLLVCGGRRGLVPLLADGAQWLRWFAATLQAQFPRVEFVLDWFHLKKKCLEKLSMICRGRPATLTQWRALLHRLWRGEVAAALEQWEALRAEGRNEKQLDELLGYLRARETAIPNYQERRLQRRFNGSGQVEKAHDLLVARRQKRRGMHWNLETSDSLAALKTLLLNGGWERYRQEREVLPFVAS